MCELYSVTPEPLWVIYGLRLVDDPEYRYIGCTRVGASKRLKQHKVDSRAKRVKPRYVLDWIRANYDKVEVDILEECPTGDTEYLFEAESYWISQIRSFGHRLTNLSDGGPSGSYGARWTLKEEQVRRGARHPMYGKKLSPEHIEKVASLRRGTKMSPESRKKMSESRMGRTVSEDTRRKISDKLKGRSPSITAIRNSAESRRGVPRGPMSEETKKKLSETKTGVKSKYPAWNKGLPNPTAHVRWHTNKGISKPETCKFCKEEKDTNDS